MTCMATCRKKVRVTDPRTNYLLRQAAAIELFFGPTHTHSLVRLACCAIDSCRVRACCKVQVERIKGAISVSATSL